MTKFLIGIDEAGRGPVAGPVAVAAFCVAMPVRETLEEFFLDGVVRDSKKLTSKARERIFKLVVAQKKSGTLLYAVSFVSAAVIDRQGIVSATRRALRRSLGSLTVLPADCLVLLDGGLTAPAEFVFQRTIVKGDEKEAVIALASIIAKVSRDRKMVLFAKKYPRYAFDVHKGYGTRAHYRKIRRHGLSSIHRRSFLKTLAV